MVAVINDPSLEAELIAERQATGADRYDEVWEGVYMMAPLANNEHQDLVAGVTTVLRIAVQWAGLGKVLPGANVSDRKQDWKQNYRCPDVVVFLNDTQAENCGTHWFGGPDFGIEILSAGDRSREKLEFYAKLGTSEFLLVDRDPWALELYRLRESQLIVVGRSTLDDAVVLASQVIPLTWCLVAGDERPQIAVVHSDGKQQWLV